MRKKAEEEKKKVISQLLAAEGLELETDDDEALQTIYFTHCHPKSYYRIHSRVSDGDT